MVIVCDCQYRSAISAIRSFHALGEEIIAVTTDKYNNPPSFSSKYIKEKAVLSSSTEEYKLQLIDLCKKHDFPIIFPTGNFTLNILSDNTDEISKYARFCVASHDTLTLTNDKKQVKEMAHKSGLMAPRKYTLNNVSSFPVVVKPYCGEKFSLKACERYKIAYNESELVTAYEHFKKYDEEPIIEEFISGYGLGISVVLNNDSQVQTYFSHKRLIEYPITGGPSALLKTVYDEELIKKTCRFFEDINFKGIAMAEFKCNESGAYLLEINPRVWGSFPATSGAKSDFIASYVRACREEECFVTGEYKKNKKIKFTRGIAAATLSYFKHFKFLNGFRSLWELINPFTTDPIFSIKDPIPFFKELFRR